MLMKASRFEASLFSKFAFRKFTAPRKRLGVIKLNKQDVSESTFRKAQLSVKKKERIMLPSYNFEGGGKRKYPIAEFLSQPSGLVALLNTSALQSFEALDSNTYRCTLPRLNLLNFDVAPVLDLRVTPTDEDCMVEMLSCKFEGSEIVERQNDHFSAMMTNYITWGTSNSEPFLDIDVKLNLTLEIYTQPFTLLPTSAVEAPGTLMMQALVDRLVPLLLQQLLREYEIWVKEKCELNSKSDSRFVEYIKNLKCGIFEKSHYGSSGLHNWTDVYIPPSDISQVNMGMGLQHVSVIFSL